VNEEGISAEVCDFIHSHIHSLEQLEILLFLHWKSDETASVPEIFSRIQSSQASILERLKQLKDGGLVEETSPGAFRFHPKNDSMRKLVQLLDSSYRERRVKVIETIYTVKQDSMQSFAEAFRFKKKE